MALEAGNSIVMTNHYMFVAKAISSENVKIHVARAEEGFLGFRLARMPKNYHITDHFTVMDTSEKSIFLYVSDDRYKEPVGNLFISDGLGYRFQHSLENIIKGGGAVDFETIESLDGTYIANRFDENHGEGTSTNAGNLRQSIEEMMDEENLEKEEKSRMATTSMSKGQAKTHKGNMKRANRESMTLPSFREKIRTYISHNKGASWELIRAPAEDMKGKAISCYMEDECSLHLQMYTNNNDKFAPPYSQESAMGLVMSIGVIGTKLDFDKGARRGTFLSRDGGLNWQEVAKIPLIYEFGDHGGLLVAAPNIQSTT